MPAEHDDAVKVNEIAPDPPTMKSAKLGPSAQRRETG